mmetsp:Transcript_35087/g.76621  ORF Transcript_35087/g.76621 Transcript_35087/m.76621 type:complete len:620 (-) Transcript_35087:135-1994(-)
MTSGEPPPEDSPPPPTPVPAVGRLATLRGRRRQRRGQRAREAHNPWAEVAPGDKGTVSSAAAPTQANRMILEFKTTPCKGPSEATAHDHRCCPFYHGERDRRRPMAAGDGSIVSMFHYSAEPCGAQFDDGRICRFGDNCDLCHTTAELLYHPDFFRKRLCHQARRCPRGRFCAFAHSRQELLVPHFGEADERSPSETFIAQRFKTQWCPIGGPHDWENCVYAHTYRDWRRSPSLGYSSRPCHQWTQSVLGGPAELSYSERCPRGVACPLAHGAKEQLYHPLFYKTSPCSEVNCRRGTLCAFMHGPHDARPSHSEESAGRLARDPIPNAEEILRQEQPTFWKPPRYHTLEEPLRGSFVYSSAKQESFCSFAYRPSRATKGSSAPRGPRPRGPASGKARSGGGLSQSQLSQMNDVGEDGAPPANLDLYMALGQQNLSSGGGLDDSAANYPGVQATSADVASLDGLYCPPYVCQWYVCDPWNQLIRPPVGYGGQEEAWSWGPPAWHDFGPSSLSMQHGLPPLIPFQAPMSDAGTQTLTQALGEELLGRSPQGWQSGSSHPGLPSKCWLQDGLRTPSSMGSPRRTATASPTGTPSEVPSPRLVEVTSCSSGSRGSIGPLRQDA